MGPYANEMLAQLNVRRAVLSVGGINQRGCYNSNLLLVGTERAMMKAADEVIVVADSTKFGRTCLTHLCGLDQVGILVSDQEISDSWQQAVMDAGVNLVIAGQQEAELERA